MGRKLNHLHDVSTRLSRLFALLILGGLLTSACTLASLGYEFAPTWAAWEVDKFLDLDASQKEIVHRRLDEFRQWHRRDQLPRYVAFVREFERDSARPVPASRIAAAREFATGEAWPPVAARVAPGMAELLVTLRPSQLAHLRREIADANRKWLKERMRGGDREAAVKARAERMFERTEFFLGSLDRDQKRMLREQAGEMPVNDDAWYAEREARQARLVALVERVIAERPPQAVAEQWCAAWLRDLWRVPDPDRKVRIDQSNAATDHLLERILAGASDAQRRHLSKRLEDFASQFAKIAAAP